MSNTFNCIHWDINKGLFYPKEEIWDPIPNLQIVVACKNGHKMIENWNFHCNMPFSPPILRNALNSILMRFYYWVVTVFKLKILVSKSNALIKRKLVDRVRFRFVRVFRFGRLIKSRFDTIEPSSSDSTPILPPSVFLILEFWFSWLEWNRNRWR